jgi:hypothetical protein
MALRDISKRASFLRRGLIDVPSEHQVGGAPFIASPQPGVVNVTSNANLEERSFSVVRICMFNTFAALLLLQKPYDLRCLSDPLKRNV